jgi:hypothetical protein
MLNPETPRRLQRHVSVQQVEAETLVYDERRHQAFCLNESSSTVWRLADGKHTVAQIRAAASVELKAEVSEEFVLFALEELRRDGLVEPSTITARPAMSRRVLLQRLGVGGALLVPAVAAIVAPTAAQAYSGCVDCTSSAVPQSNARKRQLRAKELAPSGGSTAPQTTPRQ